MFSKAAKGQWWRPFHPISIKMHGTRSKKKQPKLECGICSEELEEFKMVKLFVCDHLFCEGCTSSFVEEKLKMHQLFDCPSCRSPCDENSVFFFSLNVEEQEKLIQINLRKQVEKNQKTIRHCPDQKCPLGIIRLANQKQKKGTCEECLKEYWIITWKMKMGRLHYCSMEKSNLYSL